MIREDRELLAELARLNTDMAPLAMRIMEDSAGTAEQSRYAQRLIAAGEWLQRRVNETSGIVIDGEVLANDPLILPTAVAPRRRYRPGTSLPNSRGCPG